MLDWIGHAVRSLGYPGIVLLMTAENLFPPIPSEVVMPLAGWTAERDGLSFAGVVLAGTLGSVLGALALYAVGAWIREERLRTWVSRHGHWLLLSTADLDRAVGGFRRHGVAAVLVARLIPGIRSLVSLPAGLSRMPLGRFVLLTAVGTGVWAGLLAWLGRALGERYGVVGTYLGPAAAAILVGLVIAYVVRALRLRRRREHRPPGRG